jgi:hypothetical protein
MGLPRYASQKCGACNLKDFGVIKVGHVAMFFQWFHLSSPLTAGPAGTYPF